MYGEWIPEPMEARYEVTEDGCWLWTRAVGSDGVGRVYAKGRHHMAHRYMLEASGVEIPEGMFVRRTCENVTCVNPEHQVLASRRDLAPRSPHCARGHEFTPENTGRQRTGRYCKTCHVEAGKRRLNVPTPSDDQLFHVEAEPEREVEPELEVMPDVKWTERMMLDLIHAKYDIRSGNGQRYVVAEHVRNQCGFGGYWADDRLPLRIIDALVVDLWPSKGHVIHGFEVKVSRADWLTELKNPEKAEAFKPYVDHWWLVVPYARIVQHDLPEGWGLMALDANGSLRARTKAPKLDREPMPFPMTAAWLRATAKTARRAA